MYLWCLLPLRSEVVASGWPLGAKSGRAIPLSDLFIYYRVAAVVRTALTIDLVLCPLYLFFLHRCFQSVWDVRVHWQPVGSLLCLQLLLPRHVLFIGSSHTPCW